MEFRVRRLGPDEVGLYRAVRLEALRSDPYAFSSSHDDEVDYSDEVMAARLRASATFCVFAGDAVIGTAAVLAKLPRKVRHRGELVGMYVNAAWRGRGAADALMRAVLDHADARLRQVELNVNAENLRAVRFYERHGFAVCGRVPAATLEGARYLDELMMVRHRTEAAA